MAYPFTFNPQAAASAAAGTPPRARTRNLTKDELQAILASVSVPGAGVVPAIPGVGPSPTAGSGSMGPPLPGGSPARLGRLNRTTSGGSGSGSGSGAPSPLPSPHRSGGAAPGSARRAGQPGSLTSGAPQAASFAYAAPMAQIAWGGASPGSLPAPRRSPARSARRPPPSSAASSSSATSSRTVPRMAQIAVESDDFATLATLPANYERDDDDGGFGVGGGAVGRRGSDRERKTKASASALASASSAAPAQMEQTYRQQFEDYRKCGYLEVATEGGWLRHWCVLVGRFAMCVTRPDDVVWNRPKRVLDFRDVLVAPASAAQSAQTSDSDVDRDWVFLVWNSRNKNQAVVLRADTRDEMSGWIAAIRGAVDRPRPVLMEYRGKSVSDQEDVVAIKTSEQAVTVWVMGELEKCSAESRSLDARIVEKKDQIKAVQDKIGVFETEIVGLRKRLDSIQEAEAKKLQEFKDYKERQDVENDERSKLMQRVCEFLTQLEETSLTRLSEQKTCSLQELVEASQRSVKVISEQLPALAHGKHTTLRSLCLEILQFNAAMRDQINLFRENIERLTHEVHGGPG